MIARWPGHVPAGKTTDAPCTLPNDADVRQTRAAQGAERIDGVNISPTLEGNGGRRLSDRFMYWEFDTDGVVAQWLDGPMEGCSRSETSKDRTVRPFDRRRRSAQRGRPTPRHPEKVRRIFPHRATEARRVGQWRESETRSENKRSKASKCRRRRGSRRRLVFT